MSDSDSDGSSLYDLSVQLFYEKISSIKSSGDFATYGKIERFDNPGLQIGNERLLSLPLTEKDAKCLIALSHQAPFGKGSETIVDESVRKTWQIEANSIHFANKRWGKCLERITHDAATKLGVVNPANVRAELHKMLIYEEGGKFEQHQDTEKVAGMFGTLIVCLPSLHEGGDVVLQHHGKSMTFATDEDSAFDASYIAWYADVTHEVKLVKAGYRCALAYNLINTQQYQTCSADGQNASLCHFVNFLDEWTGAGIQIYPLDYQYTPGSLKLASLKGVDYNRVTQVSQACSQHGGFHLLLANMEMLVTNSQSEEQEDCPSELYLKRIVDLMGCDITVYDKRFVTKSRVLSIHHFENRDPDVQRGGGYMGNQHAEIYEFYKDSVMVIVPDEQFTEFLLGEKTQYSNFNRLLQRLYARWSAHGSDLRTRQDIELVCRQVLDGYPPVPNGQKNQFLGSIAHTATWLKDIQLFDEAVGKATGCFDKSAYEGLGEELDIQSPFIPQKRLEEILTQHGTISAKFSNADSYYCGFLRGNADRKDPVQQRYLSNWLDSIRCQVLGTATQVTAEDAECLVGCIIAAGNHGFNQLYGVLYQSIRQFVVRMSTNASLLVPLASELVKHTDASPATQQHLSNLLGRIIKPFSTNFDLGIYLSHNSKSNSVASIGDLLQRIGQRGLDEVTTVLDRARVQVPKLGSEEIEKFLLPFLSGLLLAVEGSSREAQLCVQAILDVYAKNYVKDEPEEPKDWLRPDEVRKCYENCSQCSQVNDFLNVNVQTCELSESRWNHSFNFYYLEDERSNGKIIVSKTLKKWKSEHCQWQSRLTVALKKIGELPQDKLRQCLGSRYNEYRELRMLKEKRSQTECGAEEATESRYQTTSTVPLKRPRSD